MWIEKKKSKILPHNRIKTRQNDVAESFSENTWSQIRYLIYSMYILCRDHCMPRFHQYVRVRTKFLITPQPVIYVQIARNEPFSKVDDCCRSCSTRDFIHVVHMVQCDHVSECSFWDSGRAFLGIVKWAALHNRHYIRTYENQLDLIRQCENIIMCIHTFRLVIIIALHDVTWRKCACVSVCVYVYRLGIGTLYVYINIH